MQITETAALAEVLPNERWAENTIPELLNLLTVL